MFSKGKKKSESPLQELDAAVETDMQAEMIGEDRLTREMSNRKQAARPTGIPSLISGDVMIKGSIETEGEVQFDGTLEGDITAKGLVIGDTAIVKGQVYAESVKVSGVIEGSIHADKVELLTNANVKGDIHHTSLSIENGARFDGACRYSDTPRDKKLKDVAPAEEEIPAPVMEEAKLKPVEKVVQLAEAEPAEAEPTPIEEPKKKKTTLANKAKPMTSTNDSSFLAKNGKAELR